VALLALVPGAFTQERGDLRDNEKIEILVNTPTEAGQIKAEIQENAKLFSPEPGDRGFTSNAGPAARKRRDIEVATATGEDPDAWWTVTDEDGNPIELPKGEDEEISKADGVTLSTLDQLMSSHCNTWADKMGMAVGNPFAAVRSVTGCFAYTAGLHKNTVFFGTGGNIQTMHTPVEPPLMRPVHHHHKKSKSGKDKNPYIKPDEEMQAGHAVTNTAAAPAAPAAPVDPTIAINRLIGLKTQGHLTDAEFTAAKAKVLGL